MSQAILGYPRKADFGASAFELDFYSDTSMTCYRVGLEDVPFRTAQCVAERLTDISSNQLDL